MDTEHEGIWAIVDSGPQKVVGRITAAHVDTPTPGPLTEEELLRSSWVFLDPVYDYLSPVRPVQGQGPNGQPVLGMARDRFVMPYEATRYPAKAWVRPTKFTFFQHLHPEDVIELRHQIKQVSDHMVTTRSGLALASPEMLPKGHRGGRT